jgi:TDG/mug DNA glycosylase family protein
MQTLPDYLRDGLTLISIGINPSVNSVKAGFYFATPRNRFWRAFSASGLVCENLAPGREAVELLFTRYNIGFTDVVKRPSSSASAITTQEFRQGAVVLKEKLLRYQPKIAWFHGKEAYRNFAKYTDSLPDQIPWGQQQQSIGASLAFVTPNPSPANAAFSLEELTTWYRKLKELVGALESP